MELREITAKVGIEKYPEAMDAFYESFTMPEGPACDLALVDQLQEEFELFGDFYELTRAVGMELNNDEYRSLWVKVAAAYCMQGGVNEMKAVPVPEKDGTVISGMLPLYIHIPMIPLAVAEYRQRGFSEEEIAQLMRAYAGSLRIVKSYAGIPGLDATYHWWMSLYTKARIYQTEGLQYQLSTFPGNVLYLKNKETGQVLPMLIKGTVYRTGENILGSQCFEDDTGAFGVTFSENEETFRGHGVHDNWVDTQPKEYKKDQWEVLARPGEPCLNIHIPRGTDLSSQALDRSFAAGRKIARERYGDMGAKHIMCASWLLDPTLKELLGTASKIVGFQERFARYPMKSNGNAVFGFVFPKNYGSLESLPENTSLERKLKKLYLDGGCIHTYAGILK